MRRVGLDRILFASDRAAPNNAPPAAAWKIWRDKLPLSEDEFRDIADNVVAYRVGLGRPDRAIRPRR
jgi:predicted TIM-barrel fold metal-dependent hydrolase